MANYLKLPENLEFSKFYEYTVDYKAVNEAFLARFRLKKEYREQN